MSHVAPAFVMTEHYRAYTKLLHELHRLIRHGEGDSDAADAIRDVMDVHWRGMTSEEYAWVRQMSADLISLRRTPPITPSAEANAILP